MGLLKNILRMMMKMKKKKNNNNSNQPLQKSNHRLQQVAD
jgi:hypothetical protein